MKKLTRIFAFLAVLLVGIAITIVSCKKDEEDDSNNTGTPTNNPPQAAFTADKTTINTGESVQFTDQSTNYPTSWEWNFGDGNLSNDQNPSHTYDAIGSYNVSLRVSNTYGSDSETKDDYITVNQQTTGIPCPATPTVTDADGNVYNTVLIGDQCWMKENLNVGTRIDGTEEMTDNGVIEKYCFDDDPANCETYGGLYQWDEMMQYITQPGTQGICPPGWHVPTDEEWKILEGTVDSQYGVGDPEWDDVAYRGFDAGTNLKTTSGWNGNGNGTDLFGFSGLPGGLRDDNGFFDNVGNYGSWWTSTELKDFHAWYRFLYYNYPQVYRTHYGRKWYGISVRCLRD